MRLASMNFHILLYGLIGVGLTPFMTSFVQHQPDGDHSFSGAGKPIILSRSSLPVMTIEDRPHLAR
jgi:hypothetical protein